MTICHGLVNGQTEGCPCRCTSIATAGGDTEPTEPAAVVVGCKVFVEKYTGSEENQYRKAEILSIRHAEQIEKAEYYVHYLEFNKRLDEWVPLSRLDLTKEVEYPKPKKPKPEPGKSSSPSKDSSKKTVKNSKTKNRLSSVNRAGGTRTFPKTPKVRLRLFTLNVF